MNGNAARVARILTGILMLTALGRVLTGQTAKPYEHGMPTDWTHHAVIYTRPVTAQQVANAANDPRYWQQWIRQNMVRHLSADGEVPSQENALASHGLRVFARSQQTHGDWGEYMGIGATVGAGNFPAKYSFSVTTANCASAAQPDFVVFNTSLAASGTQPSIIAYDNLYSGCAGFGTDPNTYWAYDTRVAGVAARVKTSPVLSLDGSQIAFVQTNGNPGTAAKLVLLKWAANNGAMGATVAPTNVTVAANYPMCTAPCMFAINLTNGGGTATTDITSSIYYDYTSDTAWVGDAAGLLHKFTPFFKGAPTEIRTAPWPVQANTVAASALSSPVYDYISGNIFVGDAGGYLSRVNNTTGANATSAQLDFGTNGIVSYPALDVYSGLVYAFASNDNSTACTGAAPCAGVFQFTTTFTAGSSGTETQVGTSKAAPNPLYAGAFDLQYYTSGNSTGNLYVCGNTGANPTLYQIPVTAGVMQATSNAMSTLTTNGSTAGCSTVTDVQNPNLTGGAEERIFVSAKNNGRPTACATRGCLISFIDSPWQKSTAYAPNQKILVGTQIQVATGTTTQTSGTTAPAWSATAGAMTPDGGVTWVNQGPITAIVFPAWTINHPYAAHARILGANGYLQIALNAGTSNNVAQPVWTTNPGDQTIDNTVKWINAGTLSTAATQAIGGTSGIIIDNVVSSGTQAGASQVYFGTLGNEACTGGTGGCAVQASQSSLQ
jgi:hypothetical protein